MQPIAYIQSIAILAVLAFFAFFAVFTVSTICYGQNNRPRTAGLTYVPRNLSREGDYKVVVVPAVNPRQARLDAQTYHIGWDAVAAREGQSRVMFEVLLRKRAPYVPGTPPVTRPIPR
ncbi:MAG: hypothetical protein LBI05_01080 [Planctomycetaceae bacterium]|jgi:hypothetical protein|nr:hypothetical protein [Planctomycetaceae bacterium]